MKLGLVLPVFTADVARPLGVAARAQGFDAVFAADHVFPPGAPDRPAVEGFSLLAAVAAAHPGLGIGVLVTRAPMRPAGILAKLAAGLDHVSGGRAILGLGLGDASGRLEHEALGVPYPPIRERAELLEETCLAVRALFAGEPWAGGDRVPPVRGPLLPPASPPVWVGGTSDRVLGIAARAADGWNGWGLTAESFASRSADLTRLVAEAGRDGTVVEPTWGGIVLVGEDPADLARLESERRERGASMDIWRGTAGDLLAFREALAAAGATWLIASAVGPGDRPELIAETLGA
jgi:alkanesulfonate monooxygenase SsuD/methylene tetrahydromethanopterin reductase-like flavin-dependent oxidoreductase (luciferase family)